MCAFLSKINNDKCLDFLLSRGQKFKTKVDFCVRSYLFRSIALEIIRDCIILSGESECDARDCFKS